MDLFIKIAVAVTIIAIASYANIDAIKAIMPDLMAEAYIAMASGVIALIALLFAIIQGWQNQKHNKLSVQPILSHTVHNEIKNDIRHFSFILNNRGIGPAIIKSFVLLYEGKEVSRDSLRDYGKFLKEKMEGFKGSPIFYFSSGSIIEAGQTRPLWNIEFDPLKQYPKFIDKLDIVVEYQSIYKDKIFTYDTRKTREIIHPDSPIAKIIRIFAHIHAACFTIPRPWTEQEFFDLLERSNVFDIKHEHGFAIGQTLDDTETELLTLAIIPQEQGKGHGRDLLNQFIAEVKSKNGQSIFLEVAENNASALHLYEKAGFKRVGLRPAYYEVPNAPNIDAILMRLDIQTP